VQVRLGDPRLVPCFRCSFLIDMPPSTTPGSPSAAFAQFFANGTSLRRNITDSVLPFTPSSASDGKSIRGFPGSLSLRPVDSCLFQARRSLRHQDEILRDSFAADDVCRFLVGEESDAARCHHLGGPRLQVCERVSPIRVSRGEVRVPRSASVTVPITDRGMVSASKNSRLRSFRLVSGWFHVKSGARAVTRYCSGSTAMLYAPEMSVKASNDPTVTKSENK
jgi:hypothetical protein